MDTTRKSSATRAKRAKTHPESSERAPEESSGLASLTYEAIGLCAADLVALIAKDRTERETMVLAVADACLETIEHAAATLSPALCACCDAPHATGMEGDMLLVILMPRKDPEEGSWMGGALCPVCSMLDPAVVMPAVGARVAAMINARGVHTDFVPDIAIMTPVGNA